MLTYKKKKHCKYIFFFHTPQEAHTLCCVLFDLGLFSRNDDYFKIEVSDEVVVGIIKGRILKDDCKERGL